MLLSCHDDSLTAVSLPGKIQVRIPHEIAPYELLDRPGQVAAAVYGQRPLARDYLVRIALRKAHRAIIGKAARERTVLPGRVVMYAPGEAPRTADASA